ncbi:hypothetical protein GCM10027422_32460 [Hymenobacter arcticus]
MFKINSLPLVLAIFGGGVALCGCEKLPSASIAPKVALAPTSEALPATYTAAQQAWLNFVDKVRRGEQLDPTGQYVKDGTMLPTASTRLKRLRLDAARDKYPFQLAPDGTVVLLPKSQTVQSPGNTTNLTDPIDNPPQECPPGGCVGVPVITSTFVTSAGQGGGSGPIVDLRVALDKPIFNGYTVLNSDLNKGAGGREIYFQFTRDGASVLKGLE